MKNILILENDRKNCDYKGLEFGILQGGAKKKTLKIK